MCICGSVTDVVPFSSEIAIRETAMMMPIATLQRRNNMTRFMPGAITHDVHFEGMHPHLTFGAHLRRPALAGAYIPLTIVTDGGNQRVYLAKEELLEKLSTTFQGRQFLDTYIDSQAFTIEEYQDLRAKEISAMSIHWNYNGGILLQEMRAVMQIAHRQFNRTDEGSVTTLISADNFHQFSELQPARDLLVDRLSNDVYLLMNAIADRVLGRGSIKCAYAAISCRHPKRELAVLIGSRQLDDSGRLWEQTKKELKREANYMQTLSLGCGDIVSPLCIHEEDSAVYMVMDRYQGDLHSVLSLLRSSITDKQKLVYASSVINAVAYLHFVHILHRDIKLGNILISKEGHAKLSDFGSACEEHDEERLRESFGTTYIAPEQEPPYLLATQASDCWSLGVTLYMLFHKSLQNPVMGSSNRRYMHNLEAFKLHPYIGQHLMNQRIQQSGMLPLCQSLVCSLLKIDPSQRMNAASALGCIPKQS